MTKWISILAVALFFSTPTWSQNHQPTLEDCQLMFQDYYYLKDWEKAKANLEFIIENSPKPEEKYFVKGVKVYERLMKETKVKEAITSYQNKSLELYSQRFSIYGNDGQVQNQYLSSIYRYWISKPANYDSLATLFQNQFDEDMSAVSQSNMLAYFDVMRRSKKYKQPFEEAQVLTNYDNISKQIKLQGDEKGYMEKIDQMLLDRKSVV